MCIFSGSIQRVSGTRIFVRGDGARQVLAYGMSLSVDAEVAMVLPLPVPPAPTEDAIRFVDLSGYDEMFEDLARGVFPAPAARTQSFGMAPLEVDLVVHDVGNFEASFVPTMADFDRLDPRFQLAPDVWASLPQYADWAFAVFKLKPGAEKVHPMAFSFLRRDTTRLFFPTVHVHDGAVHDEAQFDHQLFYQPCRDVEPDPPAPPQPGVQVPFAEWTRSWRPASDFVDVARTRGLVVGDHHVYGRAMWGDHPNRDVFVDDSA